VIFENAQVAMEFDTNEHFTFSSSLHGAAAEISRALIDSRIGRGFRLITGGQKPEGTAGMRKERSYTDRVANGSNRPFPAV
jgi:hypothetical protein